MYIIYIRTICLRYELNETQSGIFIYIKYHIHFTNIHVLICSFDIAKHFMCIKLQYLLLYAIYILIYEKQDEKKKTNNQIRKDGKKRK